MTSYEIYVFFLCLIVFVALTTLFTCLVVLLAKQECKLIRAGIQDEKIIKDANKKLNKKSKCCLCQCGVFDMIISIFFCIVFGVICVISIVVGVMGNNVVKGVPIFKVVATSSMSARYEKNEYLFKNDLTDQLQVFDLVLMHELPPEEELKLYDVVVYEHITGALLIHRIVKIEEPNENHPNERHFLLQGDANSMADVFPVRYSQMKSIYRGERIRNVGSFVFFMQSPAGILCFLLVLGTVITTPILEKKIKKAVDARYVIIQEMAITEQLDTQKKENDSKEHLQKLEKDATLKKGEQNE